MRKRRDRKRAAQVWAAFFLLIMGCLLPVYVFPGRLEIPEKVETLLRQTLAEETDEERIAFVKTACGLVGQVPYFWGGKSHVPGWDPAWGRLRRVTAPGSENSGKIRRYGLDCSGFVCWAAVTAKGDAVFYDRIGEGVRAQYHRCQPVEAPRPGDLTFFPDLSHVGIVIGKDEYGCLWVVHCSASRKGVVVTPAAVGFSLYGVPPGF